MTEVYPSPSAPAITADDYFAIVPEWVLDADISDRAVRLYAIMRRYADKDSLACHPSIRLMSERLRCSIPSVQRALAELVALGAVVVTPRFDDDRRQMSNAYRLTRAPALADPRPSPAGEGGHSTETGEDITGDRQTRVTSNQSQRDQSTVANAPVRAAPKPRPINPRWETLKDLFGYEPAPGTPEHARWNRAEQIFRKLDYGPAEMQRAASLYRARMPMVEFNAMALASRAQHLLEGPAPQPRQRANGYLSTDDLVARTRSQYEHARRER